MSYNKAAKKRNHTWKVFQCLKTPRIQILLLQQRNLHLLSCVWFNPKLLRITKLFFLSTRLRRSPDKVAGLLEALGTETAAVGKLGFCFQLYGLVFDLAYPIPFSSRLGQDSLWQWGLLSRVLCELGCLLLCEGDDFQALPLWWLLPIFIFLILYFLPNILTVQTDNCKSVTVVFGWSVTEM